MSIFQLQGRFDCCKPEQQFSNTSIFTPMTFIQRKQIFSRRCRYSENENLIHGVWMALFDVRWVCTQALLNFRASTRRRRTSLIPRLDRGVDLDLLKAP